MPLHARVNAALKPLEFDVAQFGIDLSGPSKDSGASLNQDQLVVALPEIQLLEK